MRILYMNSFSRSGETLMLRTLHAHRDICALHQLLHAKEETEHQYNVFKEVKVRTPETIELSAEEAKAVGARDKPVLVVKNAIFEVPRPHYGFILVRNPFSVYASYRKLMSGVENPRIQMRRWAQNLDGELLPIVEFGDFLDGFCALYVRKMGALLGSNLPVIRYEELVSRPEQSLRVLLGALKLQWDDGVLNAHAAYPAGKKGHAGTDLSAPINPGKHDTLPELEEWERVRVYAYVSSISRQYGYRFDFPNRKIQIVPPAGTA